MPLLSLVKKALVASALLSFPAAAFAQTAEKDLVGSWNLTLTSPQGTHPTTVDIKDDGGRLVGNVTGLPGTTPASVERTETGVKIVFSVDYQGQPIEVVMSGKVTGNTLKGTVDYASGAAAGEFQGSKSGGVDAASAAAAKVGGAWTISSDGGSGWSMDLTQAGSAVSGELKNPDRGVTLPVKGTFEGGALTLNVESADASGVVKGTFDGAMLKGTYEIGGSAGSWSAVRRP
jgi:hypothetical protein